MSNNESTRPNKMEAFMKKLILGENGSSYHETPHKVRAEALDILINKKSKKPFIKGSTHLSYHLSYGSVQLTASPTQMNDIVWFMRNNKKIPAIKLVRSIANCGLKEAKDLVDYTDWSKFTFSVIVPEGYGT